MCYFFWSSLVAENANAAVSLPHCALAMQQSRARRCAAGRAWALRKPSGASGERSLTRPLTPSTIPSCSLTPFSFRAAPSQAAKAAISAGYVTTKSGAPVSKASKPLAADAALFLRVPGADGAGTGAASGATFAAAPSEESQRPQGGRTVLTPSGEAFLASAALQHKLGEAVVPVRRRSAASRASVFQHRKRSGGEKRAGGEST